MNCPGVRGHEEKHLIFLSPHPGPRALYTGVRISSFFLAELGVYEHHSGWLPHVLWEQIAVVQNAQDITEVQMLSKAKTNMAGWAFGKHKPVSQNVYINSNKFQIHGLCNHGWQKCFGGPFRVCAWFFFFFKGTVFSSEVFAQWFEMKGIVS